jgi:hypothetical protein
MTTPVSLTPIVGPVRATAQLAKDQVTAFQQLLSGANLLSLPDGKSVADLSDFSVRVMPNGSGIVSASIK